MLIQLLLIPFAVFGFLPMLSDAQTHTWFGNNTDREALLAFKSYIKHDPYGALDSWKVTAPFCTWRAVTCQTARHRVTGISLEDLSLFGSVAPHLGNLSFLTHLSLQNNSLIGRIPSELGNLTRLKTVNMSLNRIEGPIPASIGRCWRLVLLDLSSNRLQGTIPSDLGRLSMLDGMILSDNFLSGSIPDSFGNLSSLSNLILMKNSLQGSIPESLGRLSFLINIQLSSNRLDGEVPLSIFNQSSLIQIALAVNRLSGSLPPDMFSTLPSLATFFIGGNRFSGRLPVSLGNASSLIQADLSSNGFNGKIPLLHNLVNIQVLNFQSNQLITEEQGGWDFLATLSNSTQLQVFSLAGNSLSGELPKSVGNLSRRLSLLAMEDNQLEGRLPNELGNLVGLTMMSFEYNYLSGLIPASIGSLSILQGMYLHENRLSGWILQSLANLSALYEMTLYGNSLIGAIPSSFGKLHSLEILDLSANKLNGTIPKEIFKIPNLSQLLNLSFNSLSGDVPLEIGELKMIQVIDISSNQFSGVIPSSLGGCSSLVHLNVSRNSLGGPIPDSLGNVKGIEYLDLSHNNISDTIPLSLDSLRYLHFLDVSENQLQGSLPTKGVFSNKTGFLVDGNPELCGGLPEFGLQNCSSTRTKDVHRWSKTKLVIGLMVGIFAVLVFLGGLFVFLFRRKCPPRTRQASSRLSLDERQFHAYSYYDLKGATRDFSRENLIGEGRFGMVYKGVFGDGSIVAIKVMKMEDRGASKSFHNECEALRNIRHRNLVKIISVCSNPDFKALIMTYMPNGSLEDWLHRRGEMMRSGKGMSIRKRLEIARNVASAIEYLHHDCETLVVHRDLKPSNVLLDENMCAHVADFGIAKLHSNDFNNVPFNSTSGLKGTIGYIAPEYGSGGGVSSKGDIYSYGILLLEMFTGRRPTDEGFSDELDLPRWVSSALPDRVADVVDPELIRYGWEPSYEDGMVAIFEIGLRCCSENPEARPTMREVSSLIANMPLLDFPE